jgi:pimeloyl-ACP methyl ester carboxylesterase
MLKLIAGALVFVLAGCVPGRPPAAAAGAAVTSDPPRDAARPARNQQLVIASGPVHPELGRPAEMNALFLLASGPGLKPTMLLLHGLPGNERNLDLAQAVRRAGWNVLTFTYRGAWGSEGTFSIEHALVDTEAALAFLQSAPAAATYAVDAARIVVAGHSMGGYAAAATGAAHPEVAGVVLLDAWDMGEDAARVKAAGAAGRAAFIGAADDVGHSLGAITAADLADELIRRGEQWRLAPLAPSLARVPVLTLYARHGGAKHNRAFARLLEDEPGARVKAIELNSDHSFADRRITLASEVVAWLATITLRGRDD